MAVFSTSVDIDAPPGRVWAIMKDVERWQEWTPSIRRIRRLDAGPFGPGSRARVYQPKLPPADWRVTDLRDGRGFTWVSSAPGLHVTGRHELEPLAGGTRATLSIEYRGILAAVFAWLTGGLTRRYIGMEAAGLKRRSEEGG